MFIENSSELPPRKHSRLFTLESWKQSSQFIIIPLTRLISLIRLNEWIFMNLINLISHLSFHRFRLAVLMTLMSSAREQTNASAMITRCIALNDCNYPQNVLAKISGINALCHVLHLDYMFFQRKRFHQKLPTKARKGRNLLIWQSCCRMILFRLLNLLLSLHVPSTFSAVIQRWDNIFDCAW